MNDDREQSRGLHAGSEGGSSAGERGREACPGQQEQLNKGCGPATAASPSSSSTSPIPAILQPCQGVAKLRDSPLPSGLTHLPNQGPGPGAATDGPSHAEALGLWQRQDPGQEVPAQSTELSGRQLRGKA